MFVCWPEGKKSVNAVGAPAIADLNGTLHVVYLERNEDPTSWSSSSNCRDVLVHMQYDDRCQTWGNRASLGVNTGLSISLKGYAGQLFCAYTDSHDRLCYSTWSEITGWCQSKPIGNIRCTKRSFAFYNLGDSLHLLYASRTVGKWNIQDLKFEEDACCWCRSRSPPMLERPFFSGLDVTSFEGQAYIVYRDNARRPISMSTNYGGRWAAVEEVHSTASWELPAIAIVGGLLICTWVGGPDRQRELLWSQRQIIPSISMDKWMSQIDSDVYLSELSIPGSHESCATIAVPWVQCQHLSIEDQLNSGIRYFDFRCGVSFGRILLFHGSSPLGFELSNVLAGMYRWLDRSPHEAIMLQIKMEGGTGDESAFEKMLRFEFNDNAKFWALGNKIPKLGAIRGKIQLMRRFHISSGMLGINVRQWADNSPKFTIPIGPDDLLVVQDRYEYTDVAPTFAELVGRKSSAVDALIAAARDDKNPRAWYLNWCNAYALPFLSGVVASPFDIAVGRDEVSGRHQHFVPGVNPSLFKKSFLTPVKGRHGTILLDFAETPDPDLVTAIVLTNMFQSGNERSP